MTAILIEGSPGFDDYKTVFRVLESYFRPAGEVVDIYLEASGELRTIVQSIVTANEDLGFRIASDMNEPFTDCWFFVTVPEDPAITELQEAILNTGLAVTTVRI